MRVFGEIYEMKAMVNAIDAVNIYNAKFIQEPECINNLNLQKESNPGIEESEQIKK